jgi:hypothetical protein
MDYGSEVASLEATVDEEDVNLTVEHDGPRRAVVRPSESAAGVPATVFFVDGVRHVDARIVGRRDGDRLFHGAFGSYAVGASKRSRKNAWRALCSRGSTEWSRPAAARSCLQRFA